MDFEKVLIVDGFITRNEKSISKPFSIRANDENIRVCSGFYDN